MEKLTPVHPDAPGRWIDPAFGEIYKKYEEMRDQIIADFRSKHFPAAERVTAIEAARLPRTAEEAARLDAQLRANLEPIHRYMADLKMKYWLPIMTVPADHRERIRRLFGDGPLPPQED